MMQLDTTQPFDLSRRVVAHMTMRGWNEVPHACYVYEPDASEWMEQYRLLAQKKREQGQSVTLTAVLLKAIAHGLAAAPRLNAHISYHNKTDSGALHEKTNVDITLPYLLPNGRLLYPIVFGVEGLSIDGISRRIEQIAKKIERTNVDELLYRTAFTEMVERLKRFDLRALPKVIIGSIGKHRAFRLTGAKKKEYDRIPASEKLSVRDLRFGTVTVSNIGSLIPRQHGFVTLMDVIPPQVFALSLGSAQEKAGVVTDENGNKSVAVRTFLPMCLAFDHRGLDFADLVPFLNKLDEIFRNPSIIWDWVE